MPWQGLKLAKFITSLMLNRAEPLSQLPAANEKLSTQQSGVRAASTLELSHCTCSSLTSDSPARENSGRASTSSKVAASRSGRNSGFATSIAACRASFTASVAALRRTSVQLHEGAGGSRERAASEKRRRVGRRYVEMARPRQRVRLEDGLMLDLNKLLREGLGPPGTIPWPVGIRWTSSRSGEIARGSITIEKEGENRGFLRIVMGKLDQRIDLIAQPRHFGGQQWWPQFRWFISQKHHARSGGQNA